MRSPLTAAGRAGQDYLGVLTEESVRRNFLLLYELLDEVFDCGCPQAPAPPAPPAPVAAPAVAPAAPCGGTCRAAAAAAVRREHHPGAVPRPALRLSARAATR